MMLINFFKLFDLYGTSVQFTVFKNELHKTEVGGLLSILSILSIICSIIYFGKDFYSRDKPNFINQALILPLYPTVIINNSNFYLPLSITNAAGRIIDFSQYMEITVIHESYSNYTNQQFGNISTILNTINCSEITNKYQPFKSFWENSTCIVIPNKTFGGYWDGDYIHYISIQVGYCLNQKKCKNLNEIKDFLSQNPTFFNLDTIQIFTDLNDTYNIVKAKPRVIYNRLDSNLLKSLDILYKQVNVTTDFGIITRLPNTSSLISVSSQVNDFTTLDQNNTATALINYNLYLLSNADVFNITYIKLQDVFASLGGIITVVNLIFSNFAFIFNSHDKNTKLVNKLFDFSNLGSEEQIIKIMDGSHNNKKEISYNDISKSSSYNSKRSLNRISSNHIEINKEEENKVEKVNERIELGVDLKKLLNDNKQKYNLEPSIFGLFCRCKNNEKDEFLLEVFSKAKDIITKKLDIAEYLKFNEEYVALKALLFDEISNLCLTLRNRPKLYENNNFVNMNLTKSERLKRVINEFFEKKE